MPLNDRSAELLKENRRLKDEMRTLHLQLESFERELGAGGMGVGPRQQQQLAEFLASAGHMPGGGLGVTSGGQGGLNRKQEAELFGLREDVQRLLHENADLHDRTTHMQGEVMMMLRQQVNRAQELEDQGPAQHSSHNQGLAELLLANNEALVKEISDLRRSMHQGGASARHMPETNSSSSSHMPMMEDSNLTIQIPPNTAPGTPMQRPPLAKRSFSSATVPAVGGGGIGGTTAAGVHRGAPDTPAGRDSVGTPMVQLWTPMGMSGMGVGGGGGGGMFGPSSGFAPPSTPSGKQLLSKNLSQMNLPPEEWAQEVKELNGQLIECLEQLFERERETEEQQSVIAGLEDTLVVIKQHLAALYYDFAKRCDTWEERESQYKKETTTLRHEKEDLKRKLTKTEEIIGVVEREKRDEMDAKLTELSRKVVIHEVNEAILARKFVAQEEAAVQEQQNRLRLENDFVEMESTLKKRILFLEQYKAAMSARLGHLQGRLDVSVPQEDYLAVQAEIDCLREDHLSALRREVDARVMALKVFSG